MVLPFPWHFYWLDKVSTCQDPRRLQRSSQVSPAQTSLDLLLLPLACSLLASPEVVGTQRYWVGDAVGAGHLARLSTLILGVVWAVPTHLLAPETHERLRRSLMIQKDVLKRNLNRMTRLGLLSFALTLKGRGKVQRHKRRHIFGERDLILDGLFAQHLRPHTLRMTIS